MAVCGNCKDPNATVEMIRACYGNPLGSYAAVDAAHPTESVVPTIEITEGVWRLGDDTYKVVRAIHGSGHLYAKKLTDVPFWTFEYAPGAITLLQANGRKLTVDEAAAFGRLYGICISCARTLTHERSIEVGYGQTCATNNGWEW